MMEKVKSFIATPFFPISMVLVIGCFLLWVASVQGNKNKARAKGPKQDEYVYVEYDGHEYLQVRHFNLEGFVVGIGIAHSPKCEACQSKILPFRKKLNGKHQDNNQGTFYIMPTAETNTHNE